MFDDILCNIIVKGGKSVFDHGAFITNGVSDSGFTALFDINVSFEMFIFFLILTMSEMFAASKIQSFYLNKRTLGYIIYVGL